MDYTKTIPFDDFLNYKQVQLGSIFPVVVEINQIANYWIPIKSDIRIANDYNVDDYKITFMNPLVSENPYLGYAEMGINFLSDIKFDQPYLFFTTSENKKVRLL